MLSVRTMAVAFVGAFVCASGGVAARGPAPGTPAQEKVAAATVLHAGTQRLTFNDEAKCSHQPTATVIGVQVEMWGVRLSGGGAQAALQLYRPKDGSPETFSLYVKSPGVGRSYRISTMNAGAEGSGNAKLTPAGSGGVFTIDGVTMDGTKITGSIKCAAFAE